MTVRMDPCLWFRGDLAEAIAFYSGVFEDFDVVEKSWVDGQLFSARLRLCGREIVAINGGPHFTFNEAISLMLTCSDQSEVDRLWDRLGEGGQPARCGWIRDRFGLWWQVVPEQLLALLTSDDTAVRERATASMLTMDKIVIADLM